MESKFFIWFVNRIGNRNFLLSSTVKQTVSETRAQGLKYHVLEEENGSQFQLFLFFFSVNDKRGLIVKKRGCFFKSGIVLPLSRI
jgi:hypothetical protein